MSEQLITAPGGQVPSDGLPASVVGTPDGSPQGWSVGLDVGGTKVLGVVLDPAGVVRHEVRSTTVRGVDGVVDGVVAAVHELAGLAGVSVEDLAGVGIGLPGVVDPVDGSVEHAVNLGIEARVALGALVAARLGAALPVQVENDLNMAALGAAHLTDAPVADLAFLALGTGVAAGLLLDGRLRRGATGAAGEIGHLTLIVDGLPCKCGQAGCVEQYASGTAIDVAWPGPHARPAPLELFDAAAAGDPRAVEVRDRFAWAVASAVRILVLTCDVQHVVIGGGVSGVGAPLLEAVRDVLVAEAQASPFLASMGLANRISLAPAGMPVGAVGAALAGRRATEGAI
ncbi:ROK family protein [Cellulomonas edaphi]|uniref:ROK family protein n=1 Tax=Cellulomonas edaphi TaxID=3053468 RepID=A0ABT7SAB8_9CELL|nr:ROK family protein [Cellulomons edaphi]MDM7832575.1 ROK family protein [Cellulomons edaphi]